MADLIERLRACADSESRHDGFTDDLLREAAAALEAAREDAANMATDAMLLRQDAARYRWLRTKLAAANFHPEDPNGLDLGEGVALIFMLPSGSHVTPDLNWTIDQARGKGGGG